MATYKGIGFDGASGKVRTGTNLDSIAFDAQVKALDGADVTGNTKTTTLQVTDDASVGGNLIVEGDIVSRGSQNVVIQDPMIDLGLGNSTTAAKAGGFSLSMNRSSSFAIETITAAAPGVAATNAPKFTMSAATSFAASDVICVINSKEPANDGLYIVDSVSGSTVTLKGIGGTALSDSVPFAQNQVISITGDSAEAYKVDLYVLAIADGIGFQNVAGLPVGPAPKGTLLERYAASATEGSFSTLGSYQMVGAASVSLQTAYEQGNTIAVDAAHGNLAFAPAVINTTSFNVGATNNFLSSTIRATTLDLVAVGGVGGDLTLSAGSGGSIELFEGGANGLEIKGTAISLEGTAAEITRVGALKVDSSTNNLDLEAALAWNAKGTNMNMDSTNALSLDAGGAINMTSTSGIVDIDAGTFLQMNAKDSSHFQMDANSAAAKLLEINANNSGTGNAVVSISAKSNVILKNGTVEKLNVGSTSIIASAQFQASTSGGFQFGAAGQNVNAIMESGAPDWAGAADTDLVSQLAIREYVDTANAAQALDVKSGLTTAQVNLASDDLEVIGTANELEVALAKVGTVATYQLGLPSAVAITTSLNVGGTFAVTGFIDDDTFATASATTLPSSESVKNYVDAQITAQDLDVDTDSGSISIDLDSQVLGLKGTANEVETSGSGQNVVIGLPSSVIVTTSLETLTVKASNLDAKDGASAIDIANVTGDVQVQSSLQLKTGVAVSEFSIDGTLSGNSDTAIPTEKAVKTYVDAQVTAQDLDFAGDSGTGAVDLDTQSLTIAGGTNLTSSASGQTLTVDLDADISLTSVTATTIKASNLSANDGTAAMTVADADGSVQVVSDFQLATGAIVSTIDIDGTLTANSDAALPTQKAVKTYVDSIAAPLQPFTILTDGSGATISLGDVIAINGSGSAIKASASTAADARVIGICTFIDGTDIYIQQVGNNSNLSSLVAGTTYFLSASTPGALVATPPSGPGNVIFQVGFARTTGELIIAPNFIMEIG